MEYFEQRQEEEIHQAIIRSLETVAGQKVFTLRILESTPRGFEVLIVLEDKGIIMGLVEMEEINGSLAARVRGNYI